MVLLGGIVMDLHELFRLCCVIGLLLDIGYVIIEGAIFKKKYERGEWL